MPANDDFSQFVDFHAPAAQQLPAIHITPVSHFAGILSTRKLEVTPCKFVGKRICYYFYGKPSYEVIPRSHVKSQPPVKSKRLADAAVCICLKLGAISAHLEAIHAFDTGGYFKNRYDKYLARGLTIADFKLGNDLSKPAKYVTAFFDDNKGYYEGNIKNGINVRPLDVVSQTIIDMVDARLSPDFDERVASVELQVNQAIDLVAGIVDAIVAPSTLRYDPRFTDACSDWGVPPIYYRFKRATPQSRTDVIYERLGQDLEARKLI
jgi:hypothetical protein